MKLIEINPWARTVRLVDTDTMPELQGALRDKLGELQHLVTRGAGGLVEKLQEVVPCRPGKPGLDLIGDEEALLKQDRAFFVWSWLSHQKSLFCGMCYLIATKHGEDGVDWTGFEVVDASHQRQLVAALRRSVQFVTPVQAMNVARSMEEQAHA